MIQSEAATELAQRVHSEAKKRLRDQRGKERLMRLLRPMARRFELDGYTGTREHWEQLVALMKDIDRRG